MKNPIVAIRRARRKLRSPHEHDVTARVPHPPQRTSEVTGKGGVSMSEVAVVPVRDLRLVALHPADLESEQKRLTEWCGAKAAEVNTHVVELEENLLLAQRSGFKSTAIRAALSREMKRFHFFKKMRAALDAGFYVVPNMTADVFALRTNRSAPPNDDGLSTYSLRDASGRMPQTQALPLGDGRNVSADHTVQRTGSFQRDQKNYKGEITGKETVYRAWSVGFVDEIDFPFALARPEVMSATQRALALKVFDEVCAVPATMRADPMVIGRIYNGNPRNSRHVSFLIAWFLDTEVL